MSSRRRDRKSVGAGWAALPALLSPVLLALPMAVVYSGVAPPPAATYASAVATSGNASDTTAAGWELTPPGGATTLTAQFHAPSLVCSRATRAVALAVSLYSGTKKSPKFNVAGIIEQCYRGHASAVPDVGVNGGTQDIDYSLHVHPGDLVRLTVDSSRWATRATVVDLTRRHRFSLTRSKKGSGPGLVELIGEDTVLASHSTNRLPVPDFGVVLFTGAAVGGRPIGDFPPACRVAINLVSSRKLVLIFTGPIGGPDGDAFSSVWLHA